MLERMMENNPQVREMREQHPEMNINFNDPTIRSMLTDPQVIDSMVAMMGRMNTSSAGTLEGSNFPMPGC